MPDPYPKLMMPVMNPNLDLSPFIRIRELHHMAQLERYASCAMPPNLNPARHSTLYPWNT